MKKLLLLLLLIATSCTSKPDQLTKNTLNLNMRDDPTSLDPRRAQTVRDITLMRQLYEGLMRLSLDGKIEPALAESYEISDDLLTYTFVLKEARWNNGDPITAHDFTYSWMQLLNSDFIANYAYMLDPIKNGRLARLKKCNPETIGIMARDDKTLVVQLENPTPYFLELTSLPIYFPIHSRNVAKGGSDVISCGPFTLASWDMGSEMKLKKSETYWDKEHVYLDGITLTFIEDNNTESYLFDKGKLDWLGQPLSANIATEQIAKLKDEKRLSSYSIDGTFWLKVNTQKEPFNHKEMRRAFAMATNRQEIITHILQGNQAIATSPLPPSLQLQSTPYFKDGDRKAAAALFEAVLKEQTWTREMMPPITLSYHPSERNQKIVQLLQQQWQQTFGISIELQACEYKIHRSKTKAGDYQLATGEWIADFHDPLAFLELFALKEGMNDTRWSNPTYAALLKKSLHETDLLKRQTILHNAEKIVVENFPIIPLYHYSFDYVCQPHVQDVVLSPLGTTDFKSAKLR
ncbi:MAG: Oligopeptide-binding protein OppA [Chlamydiales bacterium]|nr:Oligopeptide-binding protein OppA [Chlamydiales bacterium]MCH9620449.1 Oligopeptide-binding protein OppA [Chlamydiales bacterium]MCH9623435.1 Oligopeptide-binding protein OppA [Chlamydiales bacterium]